MRILDFSSWQGIAFSVVALALITLIGVGIRLLIMQTIQVRRQRENRQINERLRTLIAAYKVLGGSFTGNLEVDPTHLRDLRRRSAAAGAGVTGRPAEADDDGDDDGTGDGDEAPWGGSDRTRRIRDAVEAALSDILLLGTDEQVRLAAQAASDLVAGRRVRTAPLVESLRAFIREVLDLEPIPPGLQMPPQGPTRPAAGGRGGPGGSRGGGQGVGGGGMGGGMGGGAAAGGAALGLGAGAGAGAVGDIPP